MPTVLKAVVNAKGLKQTWLSEKTGIEMTRLSRIIRGRVPPTADEERNLAKVLERPRRELFPVSEEATS